MSKLHLLIPKHTRPIWHPEMQPIRLKHEELQILGIVSGVIRRPG